MELLFARDDIKAEPKKVELEKVLEELEINKDKIFYFDKNNSHKDMMELVETLEEKGFNVYFREIKYGLSDEEYMYEVHAL